MLHSPRVQMSSALPVSDCHSVEFVDLGLILSSMYLRVALLCCIWFQIFITPMLINLLFMFPSIFSRLLKLVNLLFNEPGFGDQFGHLHVGMKSLWACSCSLQLHSSPGSLLCLNSRLVCCSTKHSVEVCKFLAFLAAIGRIAPQGTRSNLSTNSTLVCVYLFCQSH